MFLNYLCLWTPKTFSFPTACTNTIPYPFQFSYIPSVVDRSSKMHNYLAHIFPLYQTCWFVIQIEMLHKSFSFFIHFWVEMNCFCHLIWDFQQNLGPKINCALENPLQQHCTYPFHTYAITLSLFIFRLSLFPSLSSSLSLSHPSFGSLLSLSHSLSPSLYPYLSFTLPLFLSLSPPLPLLPLSLSLSLSLSLL